MEKEKTLRYMMVNALDTRFGARITVWVKTFSHFTSICVLIFGETSERMLNEKIMINEQKER